MSAAGRRWAAVARLVAALALVAYPAIVWCGLGRNGARPLALALLCAVAPAAWLRLRNAGAGLRGLAILPLATMAAFGCAAALDASGFLLAVPAAINAILLATFGATLRGDAVPMIERFARLQEPHLSSTQQRWCRTWTRIWCLFFALNGAAAVALAVWAPLTWWAFYNGFLAYLLIGSLLAGEWLLRRRRFRRVPADEAQRR